MLYRRRYWIAGVALVFALTVGATLFILCKPKAFLGDNTALWCQSSYLRGYQPTTKATLTDADLTRFCDTLNQNRIRYAFMFAGPYETNGLLPGYAFSPTAISNVQAIRKQCPNVKILPWVGGIINKSVFLDNTQWLSNAVNDTARLVKSLALEGVHVNFEFFTHRISDEFFPGLNGLEQYGESEIRFFRELRAVLPRAFISTVVCSTAPQTRPWKRKNTFEEIRDISQLVNQVAILCYDTAINDQLVFRECYRHQLNDIRRWKGAPDIETQFLFGLGTFINKEELWKFRDLKIESIHNTLKTLKSLILESSRDGSNLVDGLAIYAEWTTDEKEWNELRQHWTR